MRVLPLVLALLAAGLAAGLAADGDHEQAYRLRERAEILPLAEILDRLGLAPDDRILEVETEFEHGRRVYEIEYVTGQGRIVEVEVDARSGEVLRAGEH